MALVRADEGVDEGEDLTTTESDLSFFARALAISSPGLRGTRHQSSKRFSAGHHGGHEVRGEVIDALDLLRYRLAADVGRRSNVQRA